MGREVLFKLAGPGVLCGLTFSDWAKVLRENGRGMSAGCGLRVGAITMQSVQNSVLARFEKRHERRVSEVVVKPPVFILGHWRSGTTLLHELLTQDEQFGFPTTYQVSFPKNFLCSEARNAPLLNRIIPKHRPMDQMELGMGSPQEDEFALCSLTRLSPCMGWVFPQQRERFKQYLTFRGVESEVVESWKNALMWFLKKVQLRDERPLILKSPPHTGRIRLLLEMFPDARFVDIHRHPYEVFQSNRHLLGKVVEWHRLERRPPEGWDDWILEVYEQMYEAFFADWGLIPKGRAVEVGYRELEKEPMKQLERIYEDLELEGLEGMKVKGKWFFEKRRGYKKNEHREWSAGEKELVFERWGRSFERWGYLR